MLHGDSSELVLWVEGEELITFIEIHDDGVSFIGASGPLDVATTTLEILHGGEVLKARALDVPQDCDEIIWTFFIQLDTERTTV